MQTQKTGMVFVVQGNLLDPFELLVTKPLVTFTGDVVEPPFF